MFNFIALIHRQPDRHAPRAPIAALFFEPSGDFVTAGSAPTIFKVPLAKFVPIALDQYIAAAGTPRAAAIAVMHVSGVNVVQPF